MSSIALGALSTRDACCSRGELMRLGPKVCRNGQWIDPLAVPPGALIAASGSGAALCRGLRASSRRYHRPTGQIQPPGRTQDWIKLRGNVTRTRETSSERAKLVEIRPCPSSFWLDFFRGRLWTLKNRDTYISRPVPEFYFIESFRIVPANERIR